MLTRASQTYAILMTPAPAPFDLRLTAASRTRLGRPRRQTQGVA